MLLLVNFRHKNSLRAALILSGFLFLVLSGYLLWYASSTPVTNLVFLGTVLSAFSFFLIIVALQLRSRLKKREAEKTDEGV